MNDVAVGSDFATDPKLLGYLSGMRQVVKKIEEEISSIKERALLSEGAKNGALAVASALQGLIAQAVKAAQSGEIGVEEAKARRTFILQAQAIAERASEDASREMLALKGEARGLARHLSHVKEMWTASEAAERRKAEFAAELRSERDERVNREPKSAPKLSVVSNDVPKQEPNFLSADDLVAVAGPVGEPVSCSVPAVAAPVPPVVPVKRGRGRPRKNPLPAPGN